MKNVWLCVAGLSLVLSACTNAGGEDGGAQQATLDVAASSLTLDRTNASADGADAVNITVTLIGTDAQPMAGVLVALSATGEGNSLTDSVTTNAQGVATGTLKSTRNGTKTVSANVGATELSQHPTVTFVASGAHLVIRSQPTDALAGATITPNIEVTVEDSFGNIVERRTNISVSVSGGVELKGTTLVNATRGVARFVDLSVEVAGNYTLTFSAPGVPDLTSSSFTVTAGVVTHLAFVTQPTNAIAGRVMSPPVTVRALDMFGNQGDFNGEVTLLFAASAPTGASIGGAVTVTAVAGLATFSDLTVDKAATGYSFEAIAPFLGVASSTSFDIAQATPTELRFVVQPSNSVSGQLMVPAVSVALVDSLGNTASTTDVVTLSLSNNAMLDGGVSRAATAGIAEFVDLSINRAGVGYTLTATSGSLSVQSATFDVVPSAPSGLTSTFVATPSMVLADGIATSTVLTTVRDAQGNPISGKTVVLMADVGTNVVQPSMTTDVAGQVSGLVSASSPLLATVMASVDSLGFATTIAFVECTPNTTRGCYSGAPGTLGVGLCHGGTSTCDATGSWGSCVGEVVPTLEICGNGRDEDCNGSNDDSLDEDGDGWARCEGDCCDNLAGCSVPTAVNPGAIDVANGLDDDCDGTVDNAPVNTCSTATQFDAVTANHVAAAMDLCTTTTIASRRWGITASSQLMANGTTPSSTSLSNLQNSQMAVLSLFGTTVGPLKNATFAGLSTGMMRDANDPGWVNPVNGSAFGHTITLPGSGSLSAYVSQNNGQLVRGACGANSCPVGGSANDSAMVRLQIRVPTNATAFTFDYRFFSSEYANYQCSAFNDHFLALLNSASNPNGAVRNVALNALGQPVSINNGTINVCGGNALNCGPCTEGTGALAGTGFDVVNGGASQWLQATGTVTGGELMTLELMIFDVSDQSFDSDVLLDNFRWTTVTNTVVP